MKARRWCPDPRNCVNGPGRHRFRLKTCMPGKPRNRGQRRTWHGLRRGTGPQQ